jgi:hypothetical protein
LSVLGAFFGREHVPKERGKRARSLATARAAGDVIKPAFDVEQAKKEWEVAAHWIKAQVTKADEQWKKERLIFGSGSAASGGSSGAAQAAAEAKAFGDEARVDAPSSASKRTVRLHMDAILEWLLQSESTVLCTELRRLAMIALVVPPTSVDTERTFSVMNLVKTGLRNRLTTTVLERLIRIAVDGPAPAEFDFTAAVQAWGQRARRRIDLSELPNVSATFDDAAKAVQTSLKPGTAAQTKKH